MKKIFVLIITLILTSCASADLYRVTVTQGTVFNQEDIDKLQIGMSKDQVIFILGNPTFENFFEPDVWNYFYQVAKGDEILEENKIKVQFDANGLLEEVIILKLDSEL
ncbi:MAG: outer membrane protein assembly factor BamE [Proteobacteria bacterium]|uniref:Outer membrane protein assembly factor BamE n=1 Tax=SAR86 cluster bacterium TaxID=2030880 RepID=A0A937LL69_9GAMM|nr:outer membrane protein assembly factor BamE [SAR86 cluster bacterium]MBL6819789.1 outer membrane protein assembly factor BamE [SAR86 cluster bacterium]MDA0345345.1 outer membrane protein assembly factor BamE [Pseudomonadota bacterium]MDA0899454.1 outer membrane protein assembly factor BamE [Pseudomonadota bacterium]